MLYDIFFFFMIKRHYLFFAWQLTNGLRIICYNIACYYPNNKTRASSGNQVWCAHVSDYFSIKIWTLMTEFQILQSKLKSITRYLLDFRVHAILKGSLLRVQFRVFLFLEKTCSHHPRKKYFKMFSSLFFFILCNGFYNCSFLHYPIQYELAKPAENVHLCTRLF